MPPLVEYLILQSQMDRAFALNGTGSIYSRYGFFWGIFAKDK